MQFGEMSIRVNFIQETVHRGTVLRGTVLRGTSRRGTVRRENVFWDMSVG